MGVGCASGGGGWWGGIWRGQFFCGLWVMRKTLVWVTRAFVEVLMIKFTQKKGCSMMEDIVAFGWNSTAAIACYGAVLATITFGWNLFRDLRDRGKIKIHASVRRIVEGPAGARYSITPDFPAVGASEKLYIVMTVANVGRRPMRWEGWGGHYKKNYKGQPSFLCIPHHLPKILAEKEIHQEFTELEEEFDLNNLKRLYIWDGLDGEWKLSWWQLRKLRSEAKESRARQMESALERSQRDC